VPAVAPIAGEELVAAVARQRHGDALTGEGADAVGRDGGGVGERLVVDRRQAADEIEIVGVDDPPRWRVR